MKISHLIIQNNLTELSNELNRTDWSAFPIGGIWRLDPYRCDNRRIFWVSLYGSIN